MKENTFRLTNLIMGFFYRLDFCLVRSEYVNDVLKTNDRTDQFYCYKRLTKNMVCLDAYLRDNKITSLTSSMKV